MKKLLLFALAVFFTSISFGQTLLVEDFNYTTGDLLTNHNWLLSGTTVTNPISVTSPGLSYTGYPSVAGNAATLTTTGQDVYQSFTPVSSGDVYISFLLNVQSAQSGDYFIALSPSTAQTNYYLRLHAKSSGSGYSLGLNKSNEVTGGSVYGTTVLNFNTTYVVVARYSFSAAATTDDIEYVYVFASPALPSSEPSTPEVGPYTNSTKNDATDLGFVTLRQGSTTAAAALIIDGIRIATSWTALLGGGAGFAAPVASAAANISTTGFTANWAAVSGATDYFIDVSTAADFSTFVAGYNNKDAGNVTTLNIVSLTANTIYYYRVCATNGTATSASSNAIKVTTAVLNAPVALAAINSTATGFTAVWKKVTGAIDYWIDLSTAQDFSSFVTGYNNTEAGNDTTLIISSLNSATTYYYRVRSSNTNGISPSSNVITASTSGLAVPAAPVAIAASNLTAGGFTARWNISANANDYLLDISAVSDFSTFVTGFNGKDAGNVIVFNVTTLSSGTTYYYRVRAANSMGVSPNSNVISVVTLLAAPVATAASSITTTSFTANWNTTAGATAYWIDVSTLQDFSTFVGSYSNKSAGSATSIVVSSLTANTKYYYRVSASNSNGTSAYSNVITLTTAVTGIENNFSGLPNNFKLLPNYPNPFNPATSIRYEVSKDAFVTIKVFDVIGNEVRVLVNDERSPGRYEIKFSADALPSGIYICKMQAGDFLQTQKMILLK